MKYFPIICLLFATILWGQEERNFVTVYNQNLALVKQIRKVEIDRNKPVVEFRDVAEQLIPTSVHLRSLTDPATFQVLEQNFEYDLVNPTKILQKYIDHPIRVIYESGEVISGELLSLTSSNLVLKVEDGIRILPWGEDTQISVAELPEGLITQPTLIWQVTGVKKSSQELEVSYLTEGMSWSAEYVGILAEKEDELEVSAWVNITNNSGATFKDAHLKLVAGEIHRAPIERRVMEKGILGITAGAAKAPPSFEEKAFFEYHLYTLQRPTTLKDKQIKQISLFPTARTTTQKKLIYDSWEDDERVLVKLAFVNKKEAGMGMPLPKGVFRIYKKDGESLEFIGEDRIEHTPRNEEVLVSVGKAFDIVAERTVVDRKRISKRAEEQTIEIEFRNNKEKEAVTILVKEHLNYSNWKIEENSHPYKKVSANLCEFSVPVNANSSATLHYKVTYSW